MFCPHIPPDAESNKEEVMLLNDESHPEMTELSELFLLKNENKKKNEIIKIENFVLLEIVDCTNSS